jgi:hypothetical protein
MRNNVKMRMFVASFFHAVVCDLGFVFPSFALCRLTLAGINVKWVNFRETLFVFKNIVPGV